MTLHSSVAIVLTTFPADRDPAPLARTLVEERLVACVNILPAMRSIYRWQGKVEEATEHQLIMKTSLAKLKSLRTRLADLHPYEVPEILTLLGDASRDYLAWVNDVTR